MTSGLRHLRPACHLWMMCTCVMCPSSNTYPKLLDVAQKLRAKHPAATCAPDLTDLAPASSAVPELDSDMVRKAIRGFPRGTAPGPSGLRAQHLLDALKTMHGDEMLEQVTAMSNHLAQGKAPRELAPHLAGAALVALGKADGGVRPIAVGECMRRLVAKCLCDVFRDDARAWLWPFQIGVAVPFGVEIGTHTASQWMDRNRDQAEKVFLKIDFENAFNCVDRAAFLHEVRNRLPGLSAWAEWCYGAPSHLYFSDTTIPSEVGAQQGDPLGPLLFALALKPILLKIAGECGVATQPDAPNTAASPHPSAGACPRREPDVPNSAVSQPPADAAVSPEPPPAPAPAPGAALDLLFSYLDDGCIAGHFRAVARAFSILVAAAARIGLKLNVGKCELIPAAGPRSTVDFSVFPAGMKVLPGGNFELLGAAVGGAASRDAHTAARVAAAQPQLDAIGELPDPQVALLLLRNCASYGKVVHSMRVTPHDHHTAALTSFDHRVRECFERFTGLRPCDERWMQATLGTRHAGLGLRSAVAHAAAAYLASRSACAHQCREVDAAFAWDAEEPESHVARAVRALNSRLPEADRIPPSVPSPLKQQTLSLALDKVSLSPLLDPAVTGNARRAHVRLLLEPGAGAWLHAVPNLAFGNQVAPPSFVVMLQRRLRLPIYGAMGHCPHCAGVMDIYGDHAVACGGGGDRTLRHNKLRDIFHHFCYAAGLFPEKEKAGLLRPRPLLGNLQEDGKQAGVGGARGAEGRRPADIFLPRWRLGNPAALDFAVTSGLRVGYLTESAADGGAATRSYESHKRSFLDTAAHCKEEGIDFIPMVAEATGGSWGEDARSTLRELSKSAARLTGDP
eukprot:gene17889-biopygen41696